MALSTRTTSFRLPGYNWRKGKQAWDKHTWLYISVIIAVVAGRGGRPDLARGRRGAEAARHGVRGAHQDDDRADHLLHDRRGRRLDRQGCDRRQDRRAGAAVLHGDVDVRARDRPRRRQHHPPRRGPEHGELDLRGGRRGQDDRGVPPRHHPDDLLLGVRRRERPAGAVHRAARRLRAAGHGRRRASRSCRPSSTCSRSCSASWA